MSQLLRFVLTGGFSALVNVVARILLNRVMSFEAAIVLAYLIAMTTAWLLSRRFVFAQSGRHAGHEYARFALVNLVALLQVWGVTELLARVALPAVGWQWQTDAVAHAIGVASPVFTSYYGHRRFTFHAAAGPVAATQDRRDGRLRLALGVVMLVVAGVTVGLTLAGVVIDYYPMPYWDQWDGAVALYLRAAQDPWGVLWSWHNEHRLVLPRLVFWADIALAGGVNVLALAANLLLDAAIAWVLVRMATRDRALSPGLRMVLIGAIVIFAFSWQQQENFTWGFECQWFMANLFALLSCWSMARAVAPPRPVGALLLAMLCAVLATLSLANGLLLFPLLLLAAVLWRLPAWRVLLLLGVAALIARLFFSNAPPAAGAGPLTVVLAQPLGVLVFAMRYFGAPAWYVVPRPGVGVLGGVLVCALVAGGVVLAIRRRGVVVSPGLLLFAAFIGGTGLVTSAGRLPLGDTAAIASRYTSNTLLMLLTALLFLVLNARTRTARRAALGGLVASSLLLAGWQEHALRPDRNDWFARMVAGAAVRAGVYDHTFTAAIYPAAARLKMLSEQSRALHLGIFRPRVPRLPDVPAQVATDHACAGAVQLVQTTATPGMLGASGWLYDPALDAAPASVVFTDAAGRPIGTGVMGGATPAAAGNALPRRLGWTGFLPSTEGGFRTIGLDTARGTGCQLSETTSAPSVDVHASEPSPAEEITPLIVVASRNFVPRAIPPLVPLLVPEALRGSYVTGDQDTGSIALQPQQPVRTLRLRYATGPGGAGQALRVRLDDGSTLVFVLPGTAQALQTLVISATGERLIAAITVEDNGTGWGEWSAVAVP